MTTQIFISYRRTDSQAIADRIHDHMAHQFGADNVFQDVEDIPPGVDFREYLAQAVGSSDVLLVIIGNRWLDITDERGKRRLDDSSDFVRIEVESGLKRDNLLVIPVIVDGAIMPSAPSLPPTLRSLTYRNAVIIRHNPYFEHDIERLITRIKERFVRKRAPLWLPIALIFFTLMAIFSIVLLYAAFSDDDNNTGQSSNQESRPSANVTISQVTLTSPASITPQSPSATDTLTPQSSDLLASSPTILYPNGDRFELIYNASSFYMQNPNRTSRNVSAISFQAINVDDEEIGDLFEGAEWAIHYPILESSKCYRIEINRTGNYLRPRQCSAYNAELNHNPNNRASFWVPREDVAHFIVHWNDEEIAHCVIDNQFCEIYLPN